MGRLEAALLWRVNERVEGRVPWPVYGEVMMHLAERVFRRRPDPIVLPVEHRAWWRPDEPGQREIRTSRSADDPGRRLGVAMTDTAQGGPGAALRTPGRVVAVVVTYERLELLRAALAAVAAQTRLPDAVVVVDNASSDGTAAAVRKEFPHVDLLVLRRNTGGAGGFTIGLERALAEHDAELVWLMDDDTIPGPTALVRLVDAWSARPVAAPALVASRAVWSDGRDHPMNTPRPSPFASTSERATAGEVGCVPVRSASFVSLLVEADAVRAVGPPVADYFLWNDDFEFTTRLLRDRAGLLCPASIVEHRTRRFGGSEVDPGERFYFEVRNKAWLFTRSPGLRPLERLVYAGSSVARWGRTFSASPARAALVRAGARGLRAGLRAGPRANEVVLAGAAPWSLPDEG